MKKYILVIIIFLNSICLPALVDEPITDGSELEKITINNRLDSFILKTVLVNGDIKLLNKLDITDVQIAYLNMNELKLLKNMCYAKYGYIFTTLDMSQHFHQFPWYKPKKENIDNLISDQDKVLISRIEIFENTDLINKNFKNSELIGTWNEFMGGADQAGARVVLNKNGSFQYFYGESTPQRTIFFSGNWKYENNRLVLDVVEQDIILGGYYIENPDDIGIIDSISAKIVYNHNFIIKLPILKITGIKGYCSDENCKWLQIGSLRFLKR